MSPVVWIPLSSTPKLRARSTALCKTSSAGERPPREGVMSWRLMWMPVRLPPGTSRTSSQAILRASSPTPVPSIVTITRLMWRT